MATGRQFIPVVRSPFDIPFTIPRYCQTGGLRLEFPTGFGSSDRRRLCKSSTAMEGMAGYDTFLPMG
jgi:hypothetical protein